MADGPIAKVARSQIPATWEALARASSYGEQLLQGRIDYAKYDLFATVIAESLEASAYSPILVEYAGKAAALGIIPGARDYWSDQAVSISTTGTNESISFPDRLAALDKTYDRLVSELSKLWPRVELAIGRHAVARGPVPLVSTNGVPFRTIDPNTMAMEATVLDVVYWPWRSP